MMPRKKAETVSFEEGLKRLETIVEQLEGGELSLDETVALYKEGMELSKNCAAQLKKVQQDVKKSWKPARIHSVWLCFRRRRNNGA